MGKVTLDEAEAAWRVGAKAASGKWATGFKKVATFDKWAEKIAEKDPSISPADVKSSLGGQRFDAAQSRVSASDFEAGIDKTETGKWKEGWVAAWKKK